MMRLSVAACSSILFLSAQAFAQQPPATVAAPAPAPLRMAFVDLQRVAAESIEGKAANAKVTALTTTKSSDIAAKQKQLEADQQKLQQGGAVLSDPTRAQLQKEVDRLTVEIDRGQQDAQAAVQELQQQQLGEFQNKLRPVVEALVKELGVGLLFSLGDAGAIYVDPSLDITPEVIKRFDAASATKPGAPAEAPKATTPSATAPKPPAAAPPAATPPSAAPAGRGATPGGRGTTPGGRGATPAPAPAAPKP
jgi:outer membrane protein